MATAEAWFKHAGFYVWHCPGISRAWRLDLDDGSFVLVTDLDGFDLPYPGGPFSGCFLSSADELIEAEPELCGSRELIDWFRHITRLFAANKQRRLEQRQEYNAKQKEADT
jgi:hypothetical protein